MQRKILIAACLLLPVLIAFGQKTNKRGSKALIAATDYKQTGAPLPDLKIFTKDGKYLYNKDLENDGHLFLMLFNPTCDHCQDQAVLFKENIGLFSKSRLVLLAAPGMGPHLEFFTNSTRTNDFKGYEIGLDSSGYIEQTFQYVTLPQINIYNKERKLVKMFYGATPLDSLKQYID